MLNLVPAIREIEKQIGAIKARHRMELKEYEQSLEGLLAINEACLTCGGSGKCFRRACAEDDGDYYSCVACNGTGRKRKKDGDGNG